MTLVLEGPVVVDVSVRFVLEDHPRGPDTGHHHVGLEDAGTNRPAGVVTATAKDLG